MKTLSTNIKDLKVIQGERFNDSRGYFRELYKKKILKKKTIYFLVYLKIKKKCIKRNTFTEKIFTSKIHKCFKGSNSRCCC